MRTPTVLATVLATLLLSAPVATAAAAAPVETPPVGADPSHCWFAPPPGSGWTTTTRRFSTCARCETAGAAGVSRGDRDAYRCAFVPVGLDGDFSPFLPDGTRRTAAPDPYVDAVAPANEVQVDDAAELTGAPDGRYAVVHGRFSRFLVLDLGAGEEGVGDLQVHYALRPNDVFGVSADVHFLDRDGKRLGQGQLVVIRSTGVATVENPSPEPYRYLKILTGVRTISFDSMRAADLAPPSGA
ncbi:hypothetical protein [Umezawaea beigongshangensis]|uniref:hypothetical protein n=1 Tax=Umezawaea beigongshangensis TaxID=2780383 RepID=UPI0018F19BA4|nr:hypothetical protein [Umezawaea beigongshangensis]